MPSTPNASENFFVGNIAFLPLTASTPNASENFFVGNVSFPPLTASTPDASYNFFVGDVAYQSLIPTPNASYNFFTSTLTTPAPPAATGIVLYPISEDFSQRPPRRY